MTAPDLPPQSGVGFCTDCGGVIGDWEDLSCCPHCKTKSVPCANKNQVLVSINWQELRVLCIWAENYQRTLTDRGCGVVYAIAKRLQQQHTDRVVLTLASELGELSKKYELSVSDPALRHDVAEQTGEELGLITKKQSENRDD